MEEVNPLGSEPLPIQIIREILNPNSMLHFRHHSCDPAYPYFHVSALASGVDAVIRDCMEMPYRFGSVGAVNAGKAFHHYIQYFYRQFVRNAEFEYNMVWRGEDYGIIGDIDILDHDNQVIIELKTSINNDFITPSHITQAGAYRYMYFLLTGRNYRAVVVHYNISAHKIRTEWVSESTAAKAWNEINTVAKRALEILREGK